MACRNMLPVCSLDCFCRWLEQEGWTIEKPKGVYEVLRARKPGRERPLIVWKRLSNRSGTELTHLTVEDRDYGVIAAYHKNEREG